MRAERVDVHLSAGPWVQMVRLLKHRALHLEYFYPVSLPTLSDKYMHLAQVTRSKAQVSEPEA